MNEDNEREKIETVRFKFQWQKVFLHIKRKIINTTFYKQSYTRN